MLKLRSILVFRTYSNVYSKDELILGKLKIEYNIKGALTSDIDVLGTQESVFKIAKNTNGTASLLLVLISQVSYKEYRHFTPHVKYLKN